MITLYALDQSRAWRIAWLLEMLERDYHVEIISRDAHSKLAPESLRQIHPLGKSPILQDGELTLAESGAIVEYLIERYDTQQKLKPAPESGQLADYLFWLHYAEGSLMPLLVISLVFRRIDERPMSLLSRIITERITDGVRKSYLHPQLRLHLEYVESRLADRRWLLGDQPSGADVMMSFPLQAALSRSPQNLPNMAAYVARIETEPTWQRAEARLGKLSLQ